VTHQDTRPGRNGPYPANGHPARPAAVHLTIPADRERVVLVRSVAGHVATGLGLSVTELTDQRLAVDEACGLFLIDPRLTPLGGVLDFHFEERPDELTVTVAAGVADHAGPDVDDIGWIMLEALVDELSWSVEEGIGRLRLVKRLNRGS
jgi:serine/threonine-protein kinase RsbW